MKTEKKTLGKLPTVDCNLKPRPSTSPGLGVDKVESDQLIFSFTNIHFSAVFDITDTLLSYNPSGLHSQTPRIGDTNFSIEFHSIFSIFYKILLYYVYFYYFLIRSGLAFFLKEAQIRWRFFFFIPALFLSILAPLLTLFPSYSISLSYFILAVPIHAYLGKYLISYNPSEWYLSFLRNEMIELVRVSSQKRIIIINS